MCVRRSTARNCGRVPSGTVTGFRLQPDPFAALHVQPFTTASVPKAIAHGLFAFVRTYLLKLGFLDGRHGLMLAIYNAEYAYYKYVKLMFMQSPSRPPEFPA